jgi:T5SS/PEP-CTERM-associated repeat protein
MSRSAVRALARTLLSLAPLAALPAQGGAAGTTGIEILRTDTGAIARASGDLDGSGGFGGPGEFDEDAGEDGASASVAGSSAAGTSSQSASLSADGKTLTVSTNQLCNAHVATGDSPGSADVGASANVEFHVGTAGSFQLSGTLSGSPAGDGGTSRLDLIDPSLERPALFIANRGGSPATVQVNTSGPLEVGDYNLDVGCLANAINFPATGALTPGAEGRADIIFTAVAGDPPPGDCDGDLMTWVGGRSGAYGNPASWDPPIVPVSSEEDARCDTALVEGGGVVTMDMSVLPPASREAGLEPRGEVDVARFGRLRVRNLRELRPVGGPLELDALSPDLGERSLEVGERALVRLADGAVKARHVAIGSLGSGEVDVVGAGASLETTGRLGVGVQGEGQLLVLSGAQVDSAESLLGEADAKGSARVDGAGSLWRTGNLAVGYGYDGLLEVLGGARVESERGDVGFSYVESGGDVWVRGADAQGNRSTWSADVLDVREFGTVRVEGGLLDVASFVGMGRVGEGGGDVSVYAGGQLATRDLSNEGASLFVQEGGLLFATGRADIGSADRPERSALLFVIGPASAPQVDGLDLLNVEGDSLAQIQGGGRVHLLGTFNVGVEPVSHATLRVGDGTGATQSLLRAAEQDIFNSIVGAPGEQPASERVAPTGTLALGGGRIELTGTAHDLVIDRFGRLEAAGGVITIEPVGALENHGVVEGPFVLEGDYEQGATGTRRATILFEGQPAARARALDPLATVAFPRRALRKKPALPVAGPLVVTGDATLAGRVELQFGNGVAPRAGESFEVLDVAGAVAGEFTEVSVQGLVPGSFAFEPSLAGGKLALVSTRDAVALPAVSVKAKAKLKETAKKGGKVKLKRTGDTSVPLLVSYTLGGTAKSGVDYEALPGTIEIPAGKKSATIVVKPIADELAEGAETIELELAPNEAFAPGLTSSATIRLIGKAR